MQCLSFFAISALTLGLTACGGSDGNDGAPGQPAPPPGVDISNATEINAAITGVTIASPPVVDFTLTDGNGNAVKNLPASSISFTIAKLIPGTDGNASAWQSYINTIEQPGAGPGTQAKVQATSESGSVGTFVDNGDGSYRYTFSFDINSVTDPIAVSYQPTLTHRVSFQIRGFVPVDNPVFDYRPSDDAQSGIFSREIVKTANCNVCHENLSYHGGSRFEPYLIAAWLAAQFLSALAWAEQQTMEFIMAHNPVFRSYRIATAEYAPATDTMGRMLEYTSLYGKAGSAVFRSTSFVVHRLNTSREMSDCPPAVSCGGHRDAS